MIMSSVSLCFRHIILTLKQLNDLEKNVLHSVRYAIGADKNALIPKVLPCYKQRECPINLMDWGLEAHLQQGRFLQVAGYE